MREGVDADPLTEVGGCTDDQDVPFSRLAFEGQDVTVFLLRDVAELEVADLADPRSCFPECGDECLVSGAPTGGQQFLYVSWCQQVFSLEQMAVSLSQVGFQPFNLFREAVREGEVVGLVYPGHEPF